jgi:hypothetical protein
MNENPITICQLADYILGRKAESGQDFADAGLPIMGGCEVCGASIACYNACPSKTGYLRCADGCIGDLGYMTVEEAKEDIFSEQVISEGNLSDMLDEESDFDETL